MALERIAVLVSPRLEEDGSWREGVRAALAALLVFFDSEPALTRVCIVETLGAGPAVVEHRERVVRAFQALIVARIERELAEVSPLAAESVMASVMGVIYARLLAHEEEPLIELLGPLMGTVVTRLVAGEPIVADEEVRGNELARTIRDGRAPWITPGQGPGEGATLLADLGNPSGRRAHECLLFLAGHPDSSNREVAVGIAIAHQSQISKLLAYLDEEKLVAKRSEGAGKRNAWRLTPRGEELVRVLSVR